MHRRCLIIVLLYSIQVFCQNDDKLETELPTRITNQEESNKTQENKGVLNLDPSGMFEEATDSQYSEANEWLNKILSESLNNQNNRFNDAKPSLTEISEEVVSLWKQITLTEEWKLVRMISSLFSASNPLKEQINLEKKEECVTNDNKAGECVLYYQCDPDYSTVIEDGTTIIDLRSERAACPHYLQVCCIVDKIIHVGDSSSNKTANEKNQPDSVKIIRKDSFGEQTNTCGWNNPALNIFQPKSKEIADNSPYANYGDFPWMIALIRKLTESAVWSKKDYLGGGSLIQPSVVLTVAHKVTEIAAKDLKCRAGEWDTQTTYELFAHQERDVEKIIIHPQYYRPSLYNDIGLLFLKTPFDLTQSPNIRLACVGTTLPSPGTECFSMGWGKEFNQKNKYAVVLKKVRVPMVDASNCQSLLRKTRLGPFFVLHNSLVCAGGKGGVDTCLRDGGSSLVCPVQTLGESTRFAVFGMVAYGIRCGIANSPAVYANVPHLKSWLDTTMASEGYTSDLFTYSE